MCNEYNGWSNYNTWCVNLWFSNDQNSYNYIQEQIKEIKYPTILKIADRVREIIEEMIPESINTGLLFDLLYKAIKDVNYHELAQHYAEDFSIKLYEICLKCLNWRPEREKCYACNRTGYIEVTT